MSIIGVIQEITPERLVLLNGDYVMSEAVKKFIKPDWKGRKVDLTLDENKVISFAKFVDDVKRVGDNRIKTEHIIKLQGKEFITHAGLLDIAHENGLVGIETELLSVSTNEVPIVKAKVKMQKKDVVCVFEGIGDASKENVGGNILPHRIRMAETRAINRALRFATNIGMCSVDELKGEDKE